MASRKNKYPDTKWFKYYNANPRGRITGDCSFRAICTGLNQDYNKTVMEMAEMMCKTGYALNDTKGENSYIESKGWVKHSQPKKNDNTKYTGKEFVDWLNKHSSGGEYGRVIAHIGGHHTIAIVPEFDSKSGWFKYKINDIWDSSDGCIGNWYSKI